MKERSVDFLKSDFLKKWESIKKQIGNGNLNNQVGAKSTGQKCFNRI
jgi:hypothetical protein